jgi:hypothetical protein
MSAGDARVPLPFMERNVVIISTMTRDEACNLIRVLASAVATGSDEIPLHVRTDRRYVGDDLATNVNISTGSGLFGGNAVVTDHFVSDPVPAQTWPS